MIRPVISAAELDEVEVVLFKLRATEPWVRALYVARIVGLSDSTVPIFVVEGLRYDCGVIFNKELLCETERDEEEFEPT